MPACCQSATSWITSSCFRRPPTGTFGSVTDLQWLAANPKLVVPFRPDDSRLWTLVRDEEMPPERAKSGPLTPEQKDVIRSWIEGGSPYLDTQAAQAAAPVP